MGKIERILIFGDSIGQGFYDEENGGWVQRLQRDYLKKAVEGKDDINIINLSVSGHTSNEVLKRIEFEVLGRKREGGVLTILAIGVNDSYEKGGTRRTPVDQFRQNIDQIMNKVKALDSKMLILGCTPCVDSRVQPTAWDSILYYKNEEIKTYEAVLYKCAENSSIDFLPLWKLLNDQQSRQELIPDGIHPNSAGHEIIYNEVSKELRRILENNS